MADPKTRACANCARSKTRCIWTENTTCQRCVKSNLECTIPQSGPRRTRGKASRAGELEKKIDGIMSLLAAGRTASATTASTSAQVPSSHSADDPVIRPMPLSDPPPSSARPVLNLLPREAPSLEGNIDFVPGFRVSFSEADQILVEYRTVMLLQFPFVPISSCTAHEMYEDQPLLLKTIVYTCRPQSWPLQEATDRWFREQFAIRIVILNEKSLELLQSLLVYIAWQDFRFFSDAQDTSLLHLALGIVGDLGMNRPFEAQAVASNSIADASAKVVRGINVRTAHTLADRRAMLGVFYVTSTVWTLLRRTYPPEHTEYMEQCCEELERVGEHPTDSLLIGLVHMQRLVLQTGRLASRATATSGQYILDIPRNMLFSELHKELDRIIGGLPETLESNRGWPRCLIRVTANVLDLIWSHYHTVLVRLHEPTIYMNPPAISEGSLMKSQSLWICLKSAKSIFELMASVPVEKLTTLACSWVAHQGLANVTLTRLLFLDDPCWDTATARTFVNFPELIERLAEHFEASDRLGGPRRKTNQNGTSLQLLYAGRYRWAKGWYLSKLPLDSSTSATVGEQPSMSYTGIIDDTYWQMLFDPTLVDGLL